MNEPANDLVKEVYKKNKYSGSLTEQLIEKINSSFFISFIGVWVIHNYKLFFGILFFDATKGYSSRFDYLVRTIENSSICTLLIYPVLFSFLTLFSFYLAEQIAVFIRVVIIKKIESFWVRFSKIENEKYVDKSISEEYFNELIQLKNVLKDRNTEIFEKSQTIYKNEETINLKNVEIYQLNTNVNNYIHKQTTLEYEIDKYKMMVKSLEEKLSNIITLSIDKYSPKSPVSFEHIFSYTSKDFQKLWTSSDLSKISPNSFSDRVIEKYISTNPSLKNPNMEFDYEMDSNVKVNDGLVEIIMKYPKTSTDCFYLKLKEVDKDSYMWFKINFSELRKSPEIHSSSRVEAFNIFVQHKEIDKGWHCLHFDLNKEIYDSFNKHDIRIDRIAGFKIKGTVSIARIRIYSPVKTTPIISL